MLAVRQKLGLTEQQLVISAELDFDGNGIFGRGIQSFTRTRKLRSPTRLALSDFHHIHSRRGMEKWVPIDDGTRQSALCTILRQVHTIMLFHEYDTTRLRHCFSMVPSPCK